MSSRAMRFIGGPRHGRMVVVDHGDRYYRVPVYDRSIFSDSPSDYAPRLREVIYERRPLSFSGTRIEVMVPRDYTESAAYRALADFIEDIPRYHGEW